MSRTGNASRGCDSQEVATPTQTGRLGGVAPGMRVADATRAELRLLSKGQTETDESQGPRVAGRNSRALRLT